MVEKLSSSTENLSSSTENELNELKNYTKSREIENDLSDKEYLQEFEKLLWINVNDFSEEDLEQGLNNCRNYWSESHTYDAEMWVWVLIWSRTEALAYLYKIKDKTWEDLASKKNTYPWIYSIQIALHDLWYDIPREDWFFWPQTKEAIKKFQADNKIKVDWVPGTKTINKIIVRTIKKIKKDIENDWV